MIGGEEVWREQCSRKVTDIELEHNRLLARTLIRMANVVETLRLEAPLVINVQLSIRPDQGNGRHNTPSDCGDTTGEPEVAKLGLRSAAASPT